MKFEKNTNQTTNTHTGNNARKADRDYSYYSRVLKQPFDSIEELKTAETTYYKELKVKEDAAAQKRADAKVVEDAFKALNAARKTYKEDLTQLTKEYCEELKTLKDAFELGKKDIHEKLAAAEETYEKALKGFTDKYSQYHLTLKDGDFETTISGSATEGKTTSGSAAEGKTITTLKTSDIFDLFDWMFRI